MSLDFAVRFVPPSFGFTVKQERNSSEIYRTHNLERVNASPSLCSALLKILLAHIKFCTLFLGLHMNYVHNRDHNGTRLHYSFAVRFVSPFSGFTLNTEVEWS